MLQDKIRAASTIADSAFVLLDRHQREFAGMEWMPANLFQRKRIVYILRRMEELYASVDAVDFINIPGAAQLEKIRYRMWLDLRMAHRWQVKDHLRFMLYTNNILSGAQQILKRLHKLAHTGQITRTQTPDSTPKLPGTRLD